MKKIFAYFLIALLFCNFYIYPALSEEKTQIEERSFQTRIYDTNDQKTIMKAAINMLQDEGFIIDSVNNDLGVITASKDTPSKVISTKRKVFTVLMFGMIGYMLLNQNNPEQNNKTTITLNVETLNNQSKVRINFSSKVDEGYYQEFFSKLDKSLFIQKEKI